MTNDKHPISESQKTQTSLSNPSNVHPMVTGLGIAGGGIIGAALGHSFVGGKIGTAIGGVAGAIAGGVAVNTLAEVVRELKPTLELGANHKAIELPRHYSWAELQALSKPQGEKLQTS